MGECTLCGLPTPASPVTRSEVDGAFCCRGCLEVAVAMADMPAADRHDMIEDSPAAESIPSGATETYLRVDGMHCTTCEAFATIRGDGIDGIHRIEANYASGLARVIHDPETISPETLPGRLSGHGYRYQPLSTDGPEQPDDGPLERLLIGGFFTMLIMPWYLFYLYPSYIGIETGIFEADTTTAVGIYLPLAMIGLMTAVVLLYTGRPILRGALVSLRTRQPNMDLLVTIAALSAFAYSTVALAVGSTHLYYDVSVAIVMAVSVGRYYESSIRRDGTSRLESVAGNRVRTALRVTPDGRTSVDVEALEPGDSVLVRPGETVPLDGIVDDGIGDVDESVVTGESLPVVKEPGDEVIGGATVQTGPLVVRVGPTAESTVDRVARSLWAVQTQSPGVQRFADRLATIFVPVVLFLGIVVTAWQLIAGASIAAAMLAGLTVLVVSCPCAMGLATPLAVASGLRDGLRRNVVVTNSTLFETGPNIETVVFDKTGTVTAAEMEVVDIHGHPKTLHTAAAVERYADHPVASAILDRAMHVASDADGSYPHSVVQPDGGSVVGSEEDRPSASNFLPPTSGFTSHPGRGVSGTVDGRHVVAGTPAFVRDRMGSLSPPLAKIVEEADTAGRLPVAVGWGGAVRGIIVLADRERAAWNRVVDDLGDREIVMLSGDDSRSATRFEAMSNIDRVFTGVPPDGKLEAINRFTAAGPTAMVGDGTNDAPALAAADLGIAMGDGTAKAIDAADVIVVDNDLTAVPATFELAIGTRRRIRENIGWAFLYNGVAIPLAVVGLINPLFAALAMAMSSALVVLNSKRPVCDLPTDHERETERA